MMMVIINVMIKALMMVVVMIVIIVMMMEVHHSSSSLIIISDDLTRLKNIIIYIISRTYALCYIKLTKPLDSSSYINLILFIKYKYYF